MGGGPKGMLLRSLDVLFIGGFNDDYFWILYHFLQFYWVYYAFLSWLLLHFGLGFRCYDEIDLLALLDYLILAVLFIGAIMKESNIQTRARQLYWCHFLEYSCAQKLWIYNNFFAFPRIFVYESNAHAN